MSTREEHFTAVWHAEVSRVLAFATRHVGADAAHEVVAETFLVAWRRWDDVPDPPIGWLLVVARKVMQGRARSLRRHLALAERIALLDDVAAQAFDAAGAAISRRDALERLALLDDDHREAILLVAWDGLSQTDAAAVLGLKPATFRRRLSRARAALRAGEDEADRPVPSSRPRALTPAPVPAEELS